MCVVILFCLPNADEKIFAVFLGAPSSKIWTVVDVGPYRI